MKFKYAVSAIALLSALSTEAAIAQDQPPPQKATATGEEEIVVTATRRQTNIQKTPLSMSALSGSFLRERGILSAADAVTLVPGVSLVNAEPGRNEITIRGVNTSTATSTSTDVIANSTTAVYLDQLPVSTTTQKTPDYRFVDLARIEILRGPQGTLYGQSAMGGVIRYITNKPSMDGLRGGATSYISNTDQGGFNYGVDGYLNIPVADHVAIRIAGYGYDNDGFIDVVGTSKINNANKEKTVGGRVALRWEINDRWTLDLAYLYHNVDLGSHQIISSIYTPQGNIAFRGKPIDLRPVNTDLLQVEHKQPATEEDNLFSGELQGKFDGFTANLILGRKKLDLTSVFEAAEVTGSTETYGNNLTLQNTTTDTAELRFVSNNPGSFFDWLFGGYYENTEGTSGVLYTQSGVANPAFGLKLGDHALDSGRQLNYTEKAFYGELTLNFTDKLHLTGGYRHSEIENNYRWTYARGTLDGLLGRIALLNVNQGVSESVDTYKANLSYQVTDDVLLYAQAASGYRPGGFNPGSAFAVPAIPDNSFKSDTLWNYELGIKSAWFDRRLTVNAAVYRIDWSDIQLSTVVLTPPFYSSVQNVGKAQIDGFEFEAAFQASDSLRLSANYAYTDARLTALSQPVGVTALAKVGDPLPGTAKNAFSAMADFRTPISDGMDLVANATYRYVGGRPALLNSSLLLPAYRILDVSVGLDFANGVNVTLFADNLTNEIALEKRNAYTLSGGGTFEYLWINRPRTVGLRASVHF